MNVFLIIVFAICCLGQCVGVPLFVKHSFKTKSWKSLTIKMICSTLFVLAGFAATKISNNHTVFASLVMWGLMLGWVGDVFLGIPKKSIVFTGLGGLGFLVGHIFYIIAFRYAIRSTYPSTPAIEWYEILSVLLIVGAAVAFFLIKKIKIKPYVLVGVSLYAAFLSTMLVKALHYCIGEIAYGLPDHPIANFITLGLGAALFVVSDSTLGMMMLGGKENSLALKWTYCVAYFVARILIASSIFIVYTPTV